MFSILEWFFLGIGVGVGIIFSKAVFVIIIILFIPKILMSILKVNFPKDYKAEIALKKKIY